MAARGDQGQLVDSVIILLQLLSKHKEFIPTLSAVVFFENLDFPAFRGHFKKGTRYPQEVSDGEATTIQQSVQA